MLLLKSTAALPPMDPVLYHPKKVKSKAFVDILLTEKKRGFLTRYAISIYESENPRNKKEELFFNAYEECRTLAFVFDTNLAGILTDGVIEIGHRLDCFVINGNNNVSGT